MTDDIVKRLRSPAIVFYEYSADDGAIFSEAADRIEAQDKRVAQLEKGFKDILSLDNADTLVRIIAKACIVGAIDQDGKYCHVPENALAGEEKDA